MVGNFNRNGRDDLAIGVPFEDIGGATHAGAVKVLYSGIHGLGYTANEILMQRFQGMPETQENYDFFGKL